PDALDDRDLDAEAGEHLSQLQPDRTASQDGQRRGESFDLDRLAIGPEGDLAQSGDRGNGGRGAGRDHDRPGGFVHDAIDRDLSRPGQPSGAAYEMTALLLEALDRHPIVPVIGRLLADPPGDRAPIRRHARVSGTPWHAATLGQQVIAAYHHLGRNAAIVGTLATEQVAFDTDDVRSEERRVGK